MYRIFIFFIFISVFLLGNSQVQAYLDPGSTSMILQLVIATVVGVGIYLKLFWRRMLDFFTKKDKEKKLNNNDGNKQ